LHRAVAEGFVSDHIAASVLEDGGGHNLGGARRATIHQHGYGKLGDVLGGVGGGRLAVATPSDSAPPAELRRSKTSFFAPCFCRSRILPAISCDLPSGNASTLMWPTLSASIFSLTGGMVTISRVITIFCGSARRGRSTARVIVDPI